MASIIIDGQKYEAPAGENLLQACIGLGIDIPYFCYHPALGSVGSCRLCAVKRFRDANDTKGRIVMSCMEPIQDGMIVSVNDDEIKEFRASVIEGLMTNHPHDCPVCDEGGECHLQDMVVMTGHNYRRYNFKKRTYKNQELGPYIHHEMNRCIQCYRCVRFYKDYAGGKDFGVFGAHNQLYFGRFEDGKLESPFSGNLVEVCPTGVFTDKTLKKHYTRKWDLTNAPSICGNCSTGCNTIMGERYGIIRRVLNRYNKEINSYFLCDRGRFSYEYINADSRIKTSTYRNTEISANEAVTKAAETILGNTIGIGSPTASLEANYALKKLVGDNNFYAGIAENEFNLIKKIIEIYKTGNVYISSLYDIEQAEGVLILGEDILATAPRLALSVRQASKNKPFEKAAALNIPLWHSAAVQTVVSSNNGPVFIATPNATEIDDAATATYRNNAENIIKLGQAVLALINNDTLPKNTGIEEGKLAEVIAKSLLLCKTATIITGTQINNAEILDIAANITKALHNAKIKAGLYCVAPECNSLGLALLANQPLEAALKFIESEKAESVIILENNILERTNTDLVENAFTKCQNVIAIDHTHSAITQKANLVIASGTIAESEGTLVNSEGRMQRYFSVIPAKGGVRQAWKWLCEIMATKAGTANSMTFDQLLNEIGIDVPLLSKITEAAPLSDFRINDMKIPRQTPRFSGRTSMQANINVSEPKPQQDENAPLAFSMEGSKAVPPASLTAFYWHPGWNSVQASNRYLRDLDNVMKAKGLGIRIFDEKLNK